MICRSLNKVLINKCVSRKSADFAWLTFSAKKTLENQVAKETCIIAFGIFQPLSPGLNSFMDDQWQWMIYLQNYTCSANVRRYNKEKWSQEKEKNTSFEDLNNLHILLDCLHRARYKKADIFLPTWIWFRNLPDFVNRIVKERIFTIKEMIIFHPKKIVISVILYLLIVTNSYPGLLLHKLHLPVRTLC